MCKLKSEAMDRAGELSMEKKMDEGMGRSLRDLGGAAVRACTACDGTGWVPRDPGICSNIECPACSGSGKGGAAAPARQPKVASIGDDVRFRSMLNVVAFEHGRDPNSKAFRDAYRKFCTYIDGRSTAHAAVTPMFLLNAAMCIESPHEVPTFRKREVLASLHRVADGLQAERMATMKGGNV